MRKIPFSPPDITQLEIDNVVDTLKSGWITTGPKTKLLEKRLSQYCNTEKTVCMNSATAALELTLRLFGIGPGDEVITSAYTYTASASVIHHVGAKIVLVDTQESSLEMDYNELESKISNRTKAIIPVDIAGIMCDYDRILQIVESKKNLFIPSNKYQEELGRVLVLGDAAHSLGATYQGQMSGEVADFTCFSFHAVKNFTTAEGGAVTWKKFGLISSEEIYKEFQLLSLHGQNKDALSKTKIGSWEYDIVYPGYKCNMTDIQASIGLVQLDRYNGLIKKRKQLISLYDRSFKNLPVSLLNHTTSSGHLYMLRVDNISELQRNDIIVKLAEEGISSNVHYKPLPLMTAYKNLGFSIDEYPNAYGMYKNEITLPLYSKLSIDDAKYVADVIISLLEDLYV